MVKISPTVSRVSIVTFQRQMKGERKFDIFTGSTSSKRFSDKSSTLEVLTLSKNLSSTFIDENFISISQMKAKIHAFQ